MTPIENLRVVSAAKAYEAITEQPRPAELSHEVVSISNQLARMCLWPDEVQAVLDGLRDGLLKHNGHLPLHQDIAEELGTLSDWIGKEQQA